ncbi:PH domain-containing protein [Streptomyces sp. NBC_00237]|uniref:PH domain-containing protein n=1 Tax=Streptomyces sp. NBC_00237 TaxID=2975687 RepID=UPI0022524567|nr:PH domain-containing protein [Streptomyces sp. NBC_00237]
MRQLDKRAVLFWQVENAVGAVLVLALAAVLSYVSWFPPGWRRWVYILAAAALAFALFDALVLIPLRYRYSRYTLTTDCVIVERGRLWRRREVYPLSRILYCETRQGPILGWFNLFTVRTATIVESRSIGPLSQAEAHRFEQFVREYSP